MGMMEFLKKLKTAPEGQKLDLPPIPKDGQPVDFPEIKIDAPQFAQKLPDIPEPREFPLPPGMKDKGFEELLGNEQWDEGFSEVPQGKPMPPWQAEAQTWQTPPMHETEEPGLPPMPMQEAQYAQAMPASAQNAPPIQNIPPVQNIPPPMPAQVIKPMQNVPAFQETIAPRQEPVKQKKAEAPSNPPWTQKGWQGNFVQPEIDKSFVSYARFQYVVETINSLVKEAKLADDTVLRLKEINDDNDEIVATWQQALEEVEKHLAEFDQTLFG